MLTTPNNVVLWFTQAGRTRRKRRIEMQSYLEKAEALGISVDEYTDGEYTVVDGKVVPRWPE